MSGTVEEERAVSPSTDAKGGETTERTEWEELESWTKEELIIELVKERSIHRIMNRSLRRMIESDYPIDGGPSFEEGISSFPPKKWGRKIIEYAEKKEGEYFNEENYGLDFDYKEYLESGKKLKGFLEERAREEEEFRKLVEKYDG